VDTVEKAAVATQTPRCTRTYRGVERAGGDYASAVEWSGVALYPGVRARLLAQKQALTRALARSAPGHMIGVKVEH
jgi:hypothetical protein